MSDEQAHPQAKDGGVLAGVAALIREVGAILESSGGLVVVLVGVSAVLTIATASLGTVPDGEKATVATGAFGVLGTIVGAYFGVRVGARGKDESDKERLLANEKVVRLAAQLDGDTATQVLDHIDEQQADAEAAAAAEKSAPK